MWQGVLQTLGAGCVGMPKADRWLLVRACTHGQLQELLLQDSRRPTAMLCAAKRADGDVHTRHSGWLCFACDLKLLCPPAIALQSNEALVVVGGCAIGAGGWG